MDGRFRKRERAFANPNALFGALCGICACAIIGLVVYRLYARPAPPLRLWSPVVVEANGTETILGDSRQLEFWTPSAKTRDYLHKERGEVVPTEKWQVVTNDDAVLQFGGVLHSNLSVLGYRRVEVWGQGRTGFKPGWWWTLNVLTNYSAGDLGRAYQDYWKSGHPVFVEVIDNRGRND